MRVILWLWDNWPPVLAICACTLFVLGLAAVVAMAWRDVLGGC